MVVTIISQRNTVAQGTKRLIHLNMQNAPFSWGIFCIIRVVLTLPSELHVLSVGLFRRGRISL